jgi:hypothetical protein
MLSKVSKALVIDLVLVSSMNSTKAKEDNKTNSRFASNYKVLELCLVHQFFSKAVFEHIVTMFAQSEFIKRAKSKTTRRRGFAIIRNVYRSQN